MLSPTSVSKIIVTLTSSQVKYFYLQLAIPLNSYRFTTFELYTIKVCLMVNLKASYNGKLYMDFSKIEISDFRQNKNNN
jgi:hypothetical protein